MRTAGSFLQDAAFGGQSCMDIVVVVVTGKYTSKAIVSSFCVSLGVISGKMATRQVVVLLLDIIYCISMQ